MVSAYNQTILKLKDSGVNVLKLEMPDFFKNVHKSHEIIYSNHDIYNRSGSPLEATSIQTFYENMFLDENKPITYLKFRFNNK